MNKIKFTLLLCFFAANIGYAQQSKYFAEHWFGINYQNEVIKTAKPNLPAKTQNRATVSTGSIITLDLNQPANPQVFNLNAKKVWTETYNDTDFPFIEFNSSAFMFAHLGAGEGDSYGGYVWDGFTYSKNADNSSQTDWVANQWGNMAGGGIKTDADGNVITDTNGTVTADQNMPYLLAYYGFMCDYYSVPGLAVIFNNLYKIKSIYVNNSPWAYYTNLNGDGYARALNQDGDYFKLIIHGLDEDYVDSGKKVEYYLAKNIGGGISNLVQSAEWELVDLSALGEVGGIFFTMESSDADPVYGMKTPAYFCLDRLQVQQQQQVEYTCSITVPEGADVYVGEPQYSGYNYRPFTKKQPVAVSTEDGKTSFYYNITGKHAYRVSKDGALTQTGVFNTGESDNEIQITDEQMYSHSPEDIDRDVTHNSNYNVADIFININEKGHLKLEQGDTYQLIAHRTWTMVDNLIANYFLEPDFNYTVINESGSIDNSVVTVNNSGLLTAVGSGTAIVLVTYDAVNAHHAVGGPFFGALWAENTGVFVVSVGGSADNINSGMIINENLNTDPDHKMAATAVDAELDVFYYLEQSAGFDYTFTPEGVVSVSLAQPAITGNKLSFNGFSTDNVTGNADGSYTVRLVSGRNIVKLTSATGSIYQVLTAKSVAYTLSNITNPGGSINPGNMIDVKFSTLYHPCGKLAGIYNMSAAIQYNDIEANVSPYGAAGQYSFASHSQEYKITVPNDFNGNAFLLFNGLIKANGYGNPYGDHRNITLENGINPNFSADLRTAYFGALPTLSVPLGETGISYIETGTVKVSPNPFTDHILVNTAAACTATVYSLSGAAVLTAELLIGSNRIDTSALPKGVYLLKAGGSAVKIVK